MAEANQSVLKVLNWLKAKAATSSVLSMYPIGSVYMTANAAFDPNSEWGGVWEKIENCFLLGSGRREVGSKGGEENVTLNIYQIPSHAHDRGSTQIYGEAVCGVLWDSTATYSGALSTTKGSSALAYVRGTDCLRTMVLSAANGWSGVSGTSGGSESHNNMPPYQVVAIWKRTA